jgi:hypothetical protein
MLRAPEFRIDKLLAAYGKRMVKIGRLIER